ncbi:MAG: DUF427 domain-containing protein, partial [Planctomycetota bacterium]
PDPPGPNQESVWNYPRPPALEPEPRHVRIVFEGRVVADTTRAMRVLETSHPPVYYLPPDDIDPDAVQPAGGSSFCEWKGQAAYWDVVGPTRSAPRAAWCYPDPTAAFTPITGYLAFFCSAMDQCTVGDAVATPQPGGFYGGWITPWVVGPFKGGPGSHGW